MSGVIIIIIDTIIAFFIREKRFLISFIKNYIILIKLYLFYHIDIMYTSKYYINFYRDIELLFGYNYLNP